MKDVLPVLPALLMLFWIVADFVVSALENAKWERFESSPLSIYCPRCGAHRGEFCRGMRTEFHAAREKLLRDGAV